MFVTGDFETLQAESQHRDHVITEQVIADAAASALARPALWLRPDAITVLEC